MRKTLGFWDTHPAPAHEVRRGARVWVDESPRVHGARGCPCLRPVFGCCCPAVCRHPDHSRHSPQIASLHHLLQLLSECFAVCQHHAQPLQFLHDTPTTAFCRRTVKQHVTAEFHPIHPLHPLLPPCQIIPFIPVQPQSLSSTPHPPPSTPAIPVYPH